MKIILLCGHQPNQIALANKLAGEFSLVGIVAEKRKASGTHSLKGFMNKLVGKIMFYKIDHAWKSLMDYYRSTYKDFPATRILVTENINAQEVIDFLVREKPDLIMVSGTRMVKQEILNLSLPVGIINLHTGLSPYVKGGPNCTNWCLARNEPHLIGNTVMWLDAGVDSGNIIASEIVDLSGEESLEDIHVKVMEAAHDLYIRSAAFIEKYPEHCPSVPQNSIGKGDVFKNNQWNNRERFRLVRNIAGKRLKKMVTSSEYQLKKASLYTVKLPDRQIEAK